MQHPERVSLADLPTPIQRLPRLSAELGRDLLIWRDDCTGFAEGGNKVRKLEFLMAEAVRERATVVITCGGIQSNHARATVFAARRLGLKVDLILRIPEEGKADGPATGNMLLYQMAGARLHEFPIADYRAAGSTYRPALESLANDLRAAGERPYIITEGGSSPLGAFGYIHAVNEMLATWQRDGLPGEAPDALFCAVGSGGTHAGLALGYALARRDPSTVYGINICDDRDYFERRINALMNDTIRDYSLGIACPTLSIIDGFVGRGYSRATDDELRFYRRIATLEGIVLDPCYTGKAFYGMVESLRREPRRFGRTILFLHSGGVFANFAYAAQMASAFAAEPLA